MVLSEGPLEIDIDTVETVQDEPLMTPDGMPADQCAASREEISEHTSLAAECTTEAEGLSSERTDPVSVPETQGATVGTSAEGTDSSVKQVDPAQHQPGMDGDRENTSIARSDPVQQPQAPSRASEESMTSSCPHCQRRQGLFKEVRQGVGSVCCRITVIVFL